jgi:hypothetical protein
MVVVLLAVPAAVAAAGGFVHAFHFSILLWPFNLVLPHSQLRHLRRVCATLRSAGAHYDAELRAYLTARPRRRVPVQPLQPLGGF